MSNFPTHGSSRFPQSTHSGQSPSSAYENRRQDPVSKLIYELSKLPGIGEKTATRLAYYILKQDETYARALSEALMNAKQKIGLCSTCFTFTDASPCSICANPQRDHSVICVVERPSDMLSIEQVGSYRGVYHVLHGALSPLDGIGPDDLKLRELLQRLGSDERSVRELILANNPSVEGEATALYIAKLTRPFGVKLTQLAHGIPVGGLLEYTDRQTIGKALDNRKEMAG
jgi:recombination protein RecR